MSTQARVAHRRTPAALRSSVFATARRSRGHEPRAARSSLLCWQARTTARPKSLDKSRGGAPRRHRAQGGSLRIDRTDESAAHCESTVADLAIVNVALPTIGRELHFSGSNLQSKTRTDGR
jgi:hypothetical protein